MLRIQPDGRHRGVPDIPSDTDPSGPCRGKHCAGRHRALRHRGRRVPGHYPAEVTGASRSTEPPNGWVQCSGWLPGNSSVPYCCNNPGGCALHYPSEQ